MDCLRSHAPAAPEDRDLALNGDYRRPTAEPELLWSRCSAGLIRRDDGLPRGGDTAPVAGVQRGARSGVHVVTAIRRIADQG